MIEIVMYQPDIPGNLGACMRLCACLDLGLHVIEPAGFPLRDARLKRAAMDYAGRARLCRHASFEAFRNDRQGRLVLLSTTASEIYTGFRFEPGDLLLLGRESAGVPPEVHGAANARLRIPMAPGERSLNVVIAAAMVAGEALRQFTSK
ncbi:MAG: tRNA (cytidine(34)-2'-O)-methyltransferase [Geminicoccaceae bacterium]|nr:tRNA (cytidine(34)-2'-O)-methyltransferase [Geminicoccaceae bacterium]